MTAKRRATLLLAALLSPLLLSIANGFATPKSDFVLDIDGNSISTSREHLCAIEKKPGSNSIGGRARCWGFDHFDGRTKPPQDVEFIQLATGLFFSCGIAVDQTVHCWGAIEKSIPGLYSQITSEGDSRFACGVLIDGSLNCWGFYDVRLRPPVVSGRRFLQISCSENHCCAIDDKGYPLCWGEKSPDHIDPPLITYKEFLQSKENSGWLVREEKEEFEEEEEAGGKAAGGEGAGKEDELSYMQFRQLAVGETLSCGISLLGSHLFCWGSERVFYNSGLPRQARGPWRQVSVGSSGVCAIRGEAEGEEKTGESDWQPDSLQCWGMAKGLIATDRFPAWDQISVGSSFVCGVSMESEVECGGVFHNINDHKDIIIA